MVQEVQSYSHSRVNIGQYRSFCKLPHDNLFSCHSHSMFSEAVTAWPLQLSMGEKCHSRSPPHMTSDNASWRQADMDHRQHQDIYTSLFLIVNLVRKILVKWWNVLVLIGIDFLFIHDIHDFSVNSVGESSIATFDPPVVSTSTERPNGGRDLLPEVVTRDTDAEREVL